MNPISFQLIIENNFCFQFYQSLFHLVNKRLKFDEWMSEWVIELIIKFWEHEKKLEILSFYFFWENIKRRREKKKIFLFYFFIY